VPLPQHVAAQLTCCDCGCVAIRVWKHRRRPIGWMQPRRCTACWAGRASLSAFGGRRLIWRLNQPCGRPSVELESDGGRGEPAETEQSVFSRSPATLFDAALPAAMAKRCSPRGGSAVEAAHGPILHYLVAAAIPPTGSSRWRLTPIDRRQATGPGVGHRPGRLDDLPLARAQCAPGAACPVLALEIRWARKPAGCVASFSRWVLALRSGWRAAGEPRWDDPIPASQRFAESSPRPPGPAIP